MALGDPLTVLLIGMMLVFYLFADRGKIKIAGNLLLKVLQLLSIPLHFVE